MAYEQEAKPKQKPTIETSGKRITNKEYDEAYDVWSMFLLDQYREHKQAELIRADSADQQTLTN